MAWVALRHAGCTGGSSAYHSDCQLGGPEGPGCSLALLCLADVDVRCPAVLADGDVQHSSIILYSFGCRLEGGCAFTVRPWLSAITQATLSVVPQLHGCKHAQTLACCMLSPARTAETLPVPHPRDSC